MNNQTLTDFQGLIMQLREPQVSKMLVGINKRIEDIIIVLDNTDCCLIRQLWHN